MSQEPAAITSSSYMAAASQQNENQEPPAADVNRRLSHMEEQVKILFACVQDLQQKVESKKPRKKAKPKKNNIANLSRMESQSEEIIASSCPIYSEDPEKTQASHISQVVDDIATRVLNFEPIGLEPEPPPQKYPKPKAVAICQITESMPLTFNKRTRSIEENVAPHIMAQLTESANRVIDDEVRACFTERALHEALRAQMMAAPSVKSKRFAFALLTASLEYDNELLDKSRPSPLLKLLNSGQIADTETLLSRQCDIVANVCRATSAYFNYDKLSERDKLMKMKQLLTHLKDSVHNHLVNSYDLPMKRRKHSVSAPSASTSPNAQKMSPAGAIDIDVITLSDDEDEASTSPDEVASPASSAEGDASSPEEKPKLEDAASQSAIEEISDENVKISSSQEISAIFS